MNGWLWLLVIAGGIVLAVVFLIFMLPAIFGSLLGVVKWFEHKKYAREAKRHNKKARLIRLSRNEWRGLPLPPADSKSGELRITEYDLIHNPERISSSQFERAYFDRGLDMRVDMEILREGISNDIVIRWHPHKGRWPRERY